MCGNSFLSFLMSHQRENFLCWANVLGSGGKPWIIKSSFSELYRGLQIGIFSKNLVVLYVEESIAIESQSVLISVFWAQRSVKMTLSFCT